MQVELAIRIAASPEAVWQVLANHERMPEWMPAREVVRRRPGSTDPNGVGAVRTLRLGALVVEERITAYKPPERLEYVVIEGAPLRQHRGEVVLSPAADGTRVGWSVSFRPLIPGTGWLLRSAVRRLLARSLEGLKRRVESGSGSKLRGKIRKLARTEELPAAPRGSA